MTCTQCQGIEELFSEEYVAKELKRYQKRGPDKTTRIFIGALKDAGVKGLTLLDIGGGLGAIQHALLNAGVEHARDIDASWAYLNTARAETARRGYAERANYQHGNFVHVANNVPPADIVTLNRVICCYPDMEEMVHLSVSRAEKLYGLVFPRTNWWMQAWSGLQNFILRIMRSHFRTYLHPTQAVEKIIKSYGFQRRFYRKTFTWQIVLYSR